MYWLSLVRYELNLQKVKKQIYNQCLTNLTNKTAVSWMFGHCYFLCDFFDV